MARVYWLAAPPAATLVHQLAVCETLLHVVSAQPSEEAASCLVDRLGEFGDAFGAKGPLAVVVDAAGRVAAVLADTKTEDVAALAMQLYGATSPTLVQAAAPVLLLERVIEVELCRTLIDYWRDHDKVANRVGSAVGNVVNSEIKRRADVQLNDARLFVQLRDRMVRRIVPAILRAFHVGINVIEAPIIGCYDADSGGRFGRHRDNTSSHTAHRQFAISINLNSPDEYLGGELRFPEFGRGLYRPVAGGAVVFSSSLLHEVVPVRRGRRFGVFSFLSAGGPVRPPRV
ncbi:MAG: 2OG-Fe(II) oxygenase [Reyranella sp.]|nr:2OG-Fe(II) oxygenase [Reyranella sp.]